MTGLEFQLDPRRSALLIIDMQNDFVSQGGFHANHGKSMVPVQAIIPSIQTLLKQLPDEVKRIYVITAREPDGSDSFWRFHNILPAKVSRNREAEEGEYCVVRGSWGAEIISSLEPGPGDHMVVKRRHSAFYQTDLEACLRWWGINTLIFSGVASEICVQSTLREAFNRDFDIILAKDAVAGWNQQAHEGTVNLVNESFGISLRSEEVLQLF